MKVTVIEKLDKGKMITLPHYEEIEITNPSNDISAFSNDRQNRIIGLGSSVYKLSLASYKEIKKELTQRGLINKFDFSKK